MPETCRFGHSLQFCISVIFKETGIGRIRQTKEEAEIQFLEQGQLEMGGNNYHFILPHFLLYVLSIQRSALVGQ